MNLDDNNYLPPEEKENTCAGAMCSNSCDKEYCSKKCYINSNEELL